MLYSNQHFNIPHAMDRTVPFPNPSSPLRSIKVVILHRDIRPPCLKKHADYLSSLCSSLPKLKSLPIAGTERVRFPPVQLPHRLCRRRRTADNLEKPVVGKTNTPSEDILMARGISRQMQSRDRSQRLT